MIRKAKQNELDQLLELYLHLHETSIPEKDEQLLATWAQMMNDPNHHIIVMEQEGRLVSSCVCVIIPNLTRGGRPYALIENVVTDAAYRGRGYASACLEYAKELARECGCYKIMLLTGAKDEKTLSFYRNAGFSSGDKTAFIQKFL